MSQANILVDKDGAPRIAGLGNASILPHSTVRTVEFRASAERLPSSRVPVLTWPVESPNRTDPAPPTKASDMHAFGVIAWEVRTDSFVRR